MYQTEDVLSSSSIHQNPVVQSQLLECGTSKMDSVSGGSNANNNANLTSKQRLTITVSSIIIAICNCNFIS